MQLSHTPHIGFATQTLRNRPTPIVKPIQCRSISKSPVVLLWAIVGLSLLNSLRSTSIADDTEYFAIQVLDAKTGRGVPLVELKTTSQVSYWTDSSGCIALNEPGLWNREIYFHVASHGYEFEQDAFGYRGVKLMVRPGEKKIIEVRRINIAERLYRVTGADIYRDSFLLGRSNFAGHALNNANVTGCDSVLTAQFHGKVYWFWGDTNLHHYPLGLFHASGATSKLPIVSELEADQAPGGTEPIVPGAEQGIALEYFVGPDGNAKSTCHMPGDGPTWLEGLTVTSDRNSLANERMFASYAKIKPPLDVYERGLVEWNDETQLFEHRLRFNPNQQGYPMGHPLVWTENGQDYAVFCRPLPLVRVPNNPQAILDPDAYEVYSCFIQDSADEAPKVNRNPAGQAIWKWSHDGILPTRELEADLVGRKELQESERVFRMSTAGRDRSWTLHSASISWNEHRQRWIMLGLEVGGESSFLGEVYYAETDNLFGPWQPAVKVVTHDRMSFYNPREHPMLSASGGRFIYFEGTYTHTFSKAVVPTPRYDYNQIMYRLDLDDPRLHPQ